MKRCIPFLIVLLLCMTRVNLSALDVSGFIQTDSTWSMAQSPVKLTGNLTLRNGATLTIEPGVEVNLNGYYLYVGYSATSATLNANGARLINSGTADRKIYFRENSTGTIENCRIDNIIFELTKSGPAFINDTIANCEYPLSFEPSVLPTIEGLVLENVTNGHIRISGYTAGNIVLPKYELPYFLGSHMYIRNNDTLTMAPKTLIDLSSRDIYIGYSNTAGHLIADSVSFSSSYSSDASLVFDHNSGGAITNSHLDNVFIDINNGSPLVQNDSIINVTAPVHFDLKGNPVISGIKMRNVTNEEIQLGGTIDGYTHLAIMELPFGLHGNITVRGNDTLSIEKGAKINFHGNNITMGYSTTENGHLLADSVTFSSGFYSDRSILFKNTSSGHVTNSHLDNVFIDIERGNPTISNDSIVNVTYPVSVDLGNTATITNLAFRNVTYEAIGIGGNSSGNTTLLKANYPYLIKENLNVYKNDSLTIEKGNEIYYYSSHKISIGYSTTSGYLFADSVVFSQINNYPGSLEFNNNSGGLVKNSIFKKTNLVINNGHPVFENDSVIGVDYVAKMEMSANPVFNNMLFRDVKYEALGIQGYSNGNAHLSNMAFPIRLSGNIYIRNNDSIVIEKGTELNLGSYVINVGYGTAGHLFADSVLFTSDYYSDRYIVFDDGSKGKIINSKFDNIYLQIENALPEFENDSMINVAKPFVVSIASEVNLDGFNLRNVDNESVYLTGTLSKSDTLKSYPYPVKLNSTVYVNSGATLTIPKGTHLDLNGSYLYIGSSTNSKGCLKADSVFFSSPNYSNARVYFYFDNDSSSITNSLFDRCYVQYYNGKPTVEHCNFVNTDKAYLHNLNGRAVDALNNYWGHYSGPKHPSNPSGQGGVITDSVNYMPFLFSFYIKGVTPPAPKINSNSPYTGINLNDTAQITFELVNEGGATGPGIYTFSISKNIDIVDIISDADSIEKIEAGDTLLAMQYLLPNQVIAKEVMYKLYFDQFGSATRKVTLKIMKTATREGWVKHHLQLVPADVDTSVYPLKHIIARYPVSGGKNQLGDIVEEHKIMSPLEGVISSIRENNQYVYMTVAIDTFGIGHAGLDTTHFSVTENEVVQRTEFKVIRPSEGGGSRLIDIIFIMDNSGSMSDEQKEVAENVMAFVDSLTARGANVAFGLCRYGNGTHIEDNGILTTNADYFKNNVWARNNVGGGHEPGYDASIQSASDFNYRPGAQKIMIIITDETPDQGSNTMDETVDVCVNNGITYFAFTLEALYSEFEPIAEATQGAVYNILDDFSDVISNITKKIANTYIIQYLTTITEESKHTVTLRATWEGDTIYLTKVFYTAAAPIITRTEDTKALSNQSWPQGHNFTIEAIATDYVAPTTQNVVLYYKNTNDSVYNFIFMQNTQDSLWSANIPTQAVGAPGLDYYFTASDGQETTSLPKTDPATMPFQIGILPNYAPFLSHTAQKQYKAGDNLAFTAEIWDTTNYIDSVAIFYRYAGQILYQADTMAPGANNRYTYNIPTDVLQMVNFEYFIVAWDNFGVRASVGTADYPIVIKEQKNVPVIPNPKPNDIQDIGKVLIRTYPNPVVSWLNFDFAEGARLVEINIYNTNGQLIMQNTYDMSVDKHLSIDLGALQNGSYYYSVGSGGQIKYGSFVKAQ
jgi:hypothetical protein